MADTLFVACTRPTMKWGVPWAGIKLNGIITGAITFFAIGNPFGLLLSVAFHMALRELTRVDPHFFHKWQLWLQTKARSKTIHLWGGSRLQPSPSSVTRASEVRSSL